MSGQTNTRPRCFWCNGTEGDLVALDRSWAGASRPIHAHPDHTATAAQFITRTERLRLPFIVLFLTVLVLAPILAIVQGTNPDAAGIALGVYLVIVGAWLIALPFATPQTVRWLGARSATRLVRVLGIVIAGAGAFTAVAAL